jgi:hypothetical protein
MTDKAKFAIVGHQRTGTHFLASSLLSAPEIFLFDEVLMPVLEANPASQGLFFQYYKNLLSTDWSKLLLTDVDTFDRVFEVFFNEASSRVQQGIVGFDLKIDQLLTFPRLFWSLQNWDFKFIHLVRRNYLARMASHMVMNQRIMKGDTDLHYSRQGDHTVRMEVDQIIWWMLDDFEANRAAEEKLRHAGNRYLKVFYEDVASTSHPEIVGSIFDFLGAPKPKNVSAATLKQATRPLRETIENYDEVIAEIERRDLTQKLSPFD